MWKATAGILLLAVSAAASGSAWQVDAARSRLAFVAKQEGEPLKGEFQRWSAVMRFDPQRLEDSSFDVLIETGSATTFSSELDPYLPTRSWFFVKQFPTARFRTKSIAPAPDARYRAEGELTLRGITRPVTLTFSWQEREGGVRMQGEAVLDRSEFGVGQGEFAEDALVGHQVEVRVDLYLTPARPR